MNYWLDLQALQSDSRTRGIGRYSRGLASAMLEEWPERFSVLLNLANPDTFDDVLCWLDGRVPRDRIHAFHGLDHIRGIEEQNHGRMRACEALYDAFVRSRDIELLHVASPFDGLGDDTVVGWPSRSRSSPV